MAKKSDSTTKKAKTKETILDVAVPHLDPPTAAELAGVESERETDEALSSVSLDGETVEIGGEPIAGVLEATVEQAAPPPKTLKLFEQEVKLLLPLKELVAGAFIPNHVDVKIPDIRQGKVVGQLREGLKANHIQMHNGRHVETSVETIRWILEKIADALGIE
jgi:hypothetical protein